MKNLSFILRSFSVAGLALFIFGTAAIAQCGDGKVYSNKAQTEFDKRFDSYPKTVECPQFKGGKKALDQLIQQKMKLNATAKSQIFNLNYKFTVGCDGKIKDIKQIGDAKMDNWTNIVAIIKGTAGKWTPAKKNGIAVDCVYFGTFMINGSKFH
jgi:hypothetical protein